MGERLGQEGPSASVRGRAAGARRRYLMYLIAASAVMSIAVGIGVFFGLRARDPSVVTMPSGQSGPGRATGAVAPDTAIDSTSALPPTPFQDLELLSGTYLLSCPDWAGSKPVRLDRDPLTDDGLGSAIVGVITYGDLTGNGEDDAAMEVTCSSSIPGGADTQSVVVVGVDDDGPTQIGEPVLGYGPVIIDDRLVVRRDSPGDEMLDELFTSFVPIRVMEGELVEGGGGTSLTDSMIVTADGIGPLRIGETYQEIAARSGLTIDLSIMRDYDASCRYVSVSGFDGALDGLGSPSELRSLRFLRESFRSEKASGSTHRPRTCWRSTAISSGPNRTSTPTKSSTTFSPTARTATSSCSARTATR